MLTQIIKNYELDDVKTLLEQVENSNGSIFLSQVWLLTWLKSLSEKPLLIVCKRDSKVLGLAFWGCQKHWLGDKYFLNQTGAHDDDQVWIEHNDIICCTEYRDDVLAAMLEKLSELTNVGKITVQTTRSEQWQHSHYLPADIEQETNFCADLNISGNYIDSLSKNTRASIKRSNKLIEEKFGPIDVTIAQPSEHQDLFKKIAKIHIVKWGESDYGSGFTNPKFVEFHEQLLGINNQGNQEYAGKAKLLTVTAGDFTLGYLYVLISEHQILFYLSAINYADLGNKYKPGLSMHFYAIEHFKKLGYDRYDFLAGPARYKEQMSNSSYLVYHVVMYKNTFINKALACIKPFFRRSK